MPSSLVGYGAYRVRNSRTTRTLKIRIVIRADQTILRTTLQPVPVRRIRRIKIPIQLRTVPTLHRILRTIRMALAIPAATVVRTAPEVQAALRSDGRRVTRVRAKG